MLEFSKKVTRLTLSYVQFILINHQTSVTEVLHAYRFRSSGISLPIKMPNFNSPSSSFLTSAMEGNCDIVKGILKAIV